jgi:hypothetical protein
MSEPHLSRTELEGYVRDALDAPGAAEVEAHVLACEPCAAQLQAVARFELQLAEVARAVPQRDWHSFGPVAPALALTAVVALLLLLLPKPPARPVVDDGEAWAPDAPQAVGEALSVQFDISEIGRRTLPRYERVTPARGGFDERGVALR